MKFTTSILLLGCTASQADAVADGWSTCGGLTPARNRTACPSATATCCKQNWSPSEDRWGCVDFVNATCCSNGYTACPSGTKCQDTGSGWSVVTTCVPTDDGRGNFNEKTNSNDNSDNLGVQVCKQGAPDPLSTDLGNILIIGDSVSIGYTPYVATEMADVALVQHSPWGGDGGAEESAYGDQCLDYLLRAPDGTELRPVDAVMFNWGLHNGLNNDTVPGQSGPASEYAGPLESITKKLRAWAGPASDPTSIKLLFALTSPMLNNVQVDDIMVQHNKDASAIMAKYGVPTVDLHTPIIDECGAVPQASCFNHTGCWSPHCPAGYGWLANSTIVPALRNLLLE